MHNVDNTEYIYKVIRKDGVPAYSLRIPCKDTGKIIYIKGSKNIDFLRKIRDEILTRPQTEKELLHAKKQYKKKPSTPTIDKFIVQTLSKNGENKYQIRYNSKTYGVYSSLQEAQQLRDQLINENWDETRVEGVNVKRRPRKPGWKYIYKKTNGYAIIHTTHHEDGRCSKDVFDSGISTLEEAMKLRDWWVKVGWDWNRIDET